MQQLVVLLITTVVLFSCKEEDIHQVPANSTTIKSCSISCRVSDIQSSRSGINNNWTEGDKLFVKFGPKSNYGSYSNVGIATYSNSNWNMELRGESVELNVVTEEECWITFVKGNYSMTGSDINLSDGCSVYTSVSAKYTVTEDGDLYISGILSPFYSRFRIQGEPNATYEIKGVCWIPNSIDMWWGPDIDRHNIVESRKLTCSEEEKGKFYSPYVYGVGIGVAPIKIKIGNKVFGRENQFEYGKSYEIIMPSIEKHDNWKMEDYITKTFSINRTTVKGMVDLWHYDLIDLEAELDSEIGISAQGYLSCSIIDDSEEARVLFSFDTNGKTSGGLATGHYIESTNDEMLLDTYGSDEEYNPSFNAYVWSHTGLGTYHLYVYGKNAYVNSDSYISLSNF